MKKKIKWFIASILLLASFALLGVFVWHAVLRSGSADTLVRAEKYYRTGDFEKAKKSLSKVLKEDAANEAALRLLAEILTKEELFGAAEAVRKRLLSINPLDPELSVQYAISLNLLRDYPQTRKYLKEREQKEGLLTPAERLELCRAELEVGNRKEANLLFAKIPEKEVDPGRYTLLRADFLFLDGKRAKALPLYRSLLTEETYSREVRFFSWLRIGELAANEKEREQAYRKAAECFYSLGSVILADYYISKSKFREAADVLEKIDSEKRSFAMYRQLAEIYASLGESGKLNDLLSTIRVRSRLEISLKYYLEAIALFLKGKYSDTMVALENSKEFSYRPLYLYMKLESAIQTDAPQELILGTAGELLRAGGPDAAKRLEQSFLPLMRRYVEKKDWNQAVLLGNFVIRHQWRSPELETLYLYACLQSGEKPSYGVVDGLLKQNPNNLYALLLRAARFADRGDFSSARSDLLHVLRLQPGLESASLSLASLEERAGKRNAAEAVLRNLYAAHPDSLPAADYLFLFLERNDRAKAARFAADLQKSGLAPLRNRSSVYRGILAYASGDRASAHRLFEEALKVDKKMPGVYLYLASLLQSSGERERLLKDGLSHNPDDARITARLASLYASSNRDKEAAALYGKILESNPNDVLLLINYAEVLAGLKEYDKAMELAIRAKNLAPGNPMVRECYAMREFELKNDAAAIREFNVILKESPKNERVRSALLTSLLREGERFLEVNDRKRAEECFRRILLLDPNSKPALDALQSLNKKRLKK